MIQNIFRDSKVFEDEVRKIARQLWPAAEYDGATIIANRERDAIFFADDIIHCVECTISPRREKAREDLQKLATLVLALRKVNVALAVKGWFITIAEPTADQRVAAQDHRGLINILSFDQFRSKLIDARAYLRDRENYPFGSIRSLDEAATDVPREDFVAIDLLAIDTRARHSIGSIAQQIREGQARYLFTGDFGAGKSMTLRELYYRAKDDFVSNRSNRFPIFLNLRDHDAQRDPAEALERHGKLVPFGRSSDLVRAWRAGYVVLFLDGFDELAPRGSPGYGRRVREVRHRALELVRRFITGNPKSSPILISGRGHYFDSNDELRDALGVDQKWIHLTLSDFTADQVQDFLRKKGYTSAMPRWLPWRPLLVGYLASKEFLEGLLNPDEDQSAAEGWDHLIQHVCEREVEQMEPGLSADDLREVIERLATVARKKTRATGPLTGKEIIDTFKEVRQYEPEEKSLLALLRLPGLCGVTEGEADAPHEEHLRDFIDEDFADAAAAGDVVRFIETPYNFKTAVLSGCRRALGDIGTAVAAYKCRTLEFSDGKMSGALKQMTKKERGNMCSADIFKIMAVNSQSYCEDPLKLTDLSIDALTLGSTGVDYSRITFEDCYVSHLSLKRTRRVSHLPAFTSCYFGLVTGDIDLPPSRFTDCLVDEQGKRSLTIPEIHSRPIPPGLKILLTLLVKLFEQGGGPKARMETTLFAACPSRDQNLVDGVISILEAATVARRVRRNGRVLVIPDKTSTIRVHSILDAAEESDDPIVTQCSSLYEV